jgi:hypothetical protein
LTKNYWKFQHVFVLLRHFNYFNYFNSLQLTFYTLRLLCFFPDVIAHTLPIITFQYPNTFNIICKMLYEISILLVAWSRTWWVTFKRMVCDSSGLCIAAAIENNRDAPVPMSPPSPFFRLPRELRDTIYNLHIEDQVSNHSRRTATTKRCIGPCVTETVPWTTHRNRFPLLSVNHQTMHELQKALIKKDFTLTFDCTCLLLSFLQSPGLYEIQQEVTHLRFHWRGEIYGYPPEPAQALGRLQTLPELKHLMIRITQSLPLPERARFLESKGFATSMSRDFQWTVSDAISFDELCSGRSIEGERSGGNFQK